MFVDDFNRLCNHVLKLLHTNNQPVFDNVAHTQLVALTSKLISFSPAAVLSSPTFADQNISCSDPLFNFTRFTWEIKFWFTPTERCSFTYGMLTFESSYSCDVRVMDAAEVEFAEALNVWVGSVLSVPTLKFELFLLLRFYHVVNYTYVAHVVESETTRFRVEALKVLKKLANLYHSCHSKEQFVLMFENEYNNSSKAMFQVEDFSQVLSFAQATLLVLNSFLS